MATTPPELVEPPLINHGKDFGRVIYNLFLLAIGKYPGSSGVAVNVAPAAPADLPPLTLTKGTRTAGFTVAAGAVSFDLILSADFTGTIAGEAWSGANDAAFRQEAPAGYKLPAYAVVVTTGNVREYSLYPA